MEEVITNKDSELLATNSTKSDLEAPTSKAFGSPYVAKMLTTIAIRAKAPCKNGRPLIVWE